MFNFSNPLKLAQDAVNFAIFPPLFVMKKTRETFFPTRQVAGSPLDTGQVTSNSVEGFAAFGAVAALGVYVLVKVVKP